MSFFFFSLYYIYTFGINKTYNNINVMCDKYEDKYEGINMKMNMRDKYE